jgi:hypothetical protein
MHRESIVLQLLGRSIIGAHCFHMTQASHLQQLYVEILWQAGRQPDVRTTSRRAISNYQMIDGCSSDMCVRVDVHAE